ncbi:MAG: hypothetical protein LDL13_05730 [Calditerrivibrio sp.]|nr:hypothetical protein [Calditerrivibrio sp.]MCA1933057.1 hypothetical protein [Calditerrivibrio sp.]
MEHLQAIISISIATLILNIPFGYLRRRFKKFSLGWFLCIHAPIPIVAFMRIYLKIGLILIPIFLTFAVIGQIIGFRINRTVN